MTTARVLQRNDLGRLTGLTRLTGSLNSTPASSARARQCPGAGVVSS
jgi:hypothetical protein